MVAFQWPWGCQFKCLWSEDFSEMKVEKGRLPQRLELQCSFILTPIGAKQEDCGELEAGASDENRTRDLFFTKEVLYL